MFEIEIKAWCYDREKVIKNLNTFAEYICSIKKDDTYYHIPSGKDGDYVSVRIRKEIVKKENEVINENIFTYKKKEIRLCENGTSGKGTSIEVNNENEFTFSNPEALEILIADLGGKESLKKQKVTEVWHLETECGTANIELCFVPPLGDFLEIEIVTDTNNPNVVQKIKNIEENIFLRSGISLENIENRYYSELLKDPGFVSNRT
ncbi:MAG: hypothetical protein MJ182_00375 [Treponema sp.]|nr:hypothetical protein [Treponema sp.]